MNLFTGNLEFAVKEFDSEEGPFLKQFYEDYYMGKLEDVKNYHKKYVQEVARVLLRWNV